MSERLIARSSTPLLAAAGISLTAFFLMTVQDALAVVSRVPGWTILMVRSLTVVAAIMIFSRRSATSGVLRSHSKAELTSRSMIILAAWLCFYLAAETLAFGQLITLYFVAPVFVALMSGPFLREPLAPAQWLPVGLGLAGVMIASDVPTLNVTIPVLLALAAAMLWSVSLVMLRRMAAKDSPLVQVFYTNLVFAAATPPILAWLPYPADARDTYLMILSGVLGGLGQYALYSAAKRAPAHLVATLAYTALVFAFLVGFVAFSEVPSLSVILGAAIILVSGVLMVALERRRVGLPVVKL
ncbi:MULTISPECIES: DMT family transporter [unclassified Mesorhizobium]|uniref:DMT family transporter n=1 Tax=unclassified Mesorhizobium TaxID=325217 RepID=UPI003335984B